jgi:hypothetical protein
MATNKKPMARVGLRMHGVHRHFNVIVAGQLLQRERVGVLASCGQKSVPQPVQSGVGMGVDLRPQIPDLGFK